MYSVSENQEEFSGRSIPKRLMIRGFAGSLPFILCIVYEAINIHPATYQYFMLRGGLLCLILLMLLGAMWILDSKKNGNSISQMF